MLAYVIFFSSLVLDLPRQCLARRVLPSELPFSMENVSLVSYSELNPMLRHGRKLVTAADHKITVLPGLSQDDAASITQFAGHLNLVDPKAGALFYWLFEAPGEKSSSAPLLIWLNGGPVSINVCICIILLLKLSLCTVHYQR